MPVGRVPSNSSPRGGCLWSHFSVEQSTNMHAVFALNVLPIPLRLQLTTA